MTSVQINLASSLFSKMHDVGRALRIFRINFRRRPAVDIGAMPDHLRKDIGLPPADIALDQNIKLLNVNIRSGIIFPRPC